MTAAARRVIAAAALHGDIVVVELGGDLVSGGGMELLADDGLRSATRTMLLVGSDVFALMGARDWLARTGWSCPVLFGPTRGNNAVAAELLEELGANGITEDLAAVATAICTPSPTCDV